MVPDKYYVKRVQRETHDTYSLEMEPVGGAEATMTFKPGQFNMLYIPGNGEAPISISGDPSDTSCLVHTVRSVGNLTKATVSLKKGEVVGVRGPFGVGWPVQEAEGHDIVVIAGGIGLAPLRPAFNYVLDHREKYGRVLLLYGARMPEEMLYRSELEKWRGRFDVEVDVTVDNAGGDWHGNVGVVTTLIPWADFDPDETIAMVCGPEIMMRFTVNGLLEQDVDTENIYLSFERNMKCAVGYCGHCQFGPNFVCKDGPVFPYSDVERFMKVREV